MDTLSLTIADNQAISWQFWALTHIQSTISWLAVVAENSFYIGYLAYYLPLIESIYDELLFISVCHSWLTPITAIIEPLSAALILDMYSTSNALTLPYTNSRQFIIGSAGEAIYMPAHTQELLAIKLQNYFWFFDFQCTAINTVLIKVWFKEGVSSVVIQGLEFFCGCYFLISTYVFFTSCVFGKPASTETMDTDLFFNNVAVEAEKELSSFDDIYIALSLFLVLFGWFFLTHFLALCQAQPELTFLFICIPVLYYVIIGLPTMLAYDFGYFIFAYLRGAGTSSFLLLELFYDSIITGAYYIRLLVQGVRLLLMIVAFAGIQHLAIIHQYDAQLFFKSSFIWDDSQGLAANGALTTYFFFYNAISTALHFLYELAHLYFIITVQTAAFFVMVFWLFLYLYSFFFFEKHEAFLQDLRFKQKQTAEKFKNYFVK